MNYQLRRTVIFFLGLVGLAFVSARILLWDRAPKEKSSSRTSGEVNTGTREQPGGSGGASEPKNKHLVFPFIGKVPVHVKNEVVRWTDEDGRVVEIPFKFLYAENGVWVRAEYEAKSNEFKELPLEMLEGLYRQGGETIIGLPAEAPRLSLSEFFTLFHPRLPFEKGSKIILEHVLLHVEPAESAEPYLIMKVWGPNEHGRIVPTLYPVFVFASDWSLGEAF